MPVGDDLRGRIAFVTGATSGLGRQAVVALNTAGATVVGVGRRQELLRDLERAAPGCHTYALDLTDPDAVDEVFDEAQRATGGFDVLVNCASDGGDGARAERETRDEVQRLLELNVLAPLHLCQLAFPAMVERGGGSIVNVTSISGERGIGRVPQAGYVASKHALTGLTRELALQWGRHGIRVNAVAPGFFETAMTEPLFGHERVGPWIEARTALPRRAGPDDVVGALLFLASDAAAWVTGQVLCVDGGWTAT